MRRKINVIFAVALGIAGCGNADESTALEDEFATALPSTETLELTVDEESTIESEGEAVFSPSSFYDQAREVAQRVNAARETIQSHMDDLRESVEPTTADIDGLECALWEQDRERFHAKLSACRLDERPHRYRIKLEGRPLNGADEDYLVLAIGRGRALGTHIGTERRVAGTLGYNFDHARTLFRNEGPTGRIVFGYRNRGGVRQLRIAVDEVQWNTTSEVRSAFHNYIWKLGRGGKLTYSRHSDFLKTGDQGEFVAGQDGLREAGRVSLTWGRNAGSARAAATICGGTLGENECRRVVRCYLTSAEVPSFEEVLTEPTSVVSFDEIQCPAVEFEPDAPHANLDQVDAPIVDRDEIPGPDVEEPLPSADENLE